MPTKRLTSVGDGAGIVIAPPIARPNRRQKLEKARTRMQGDIGETLGKLAR